MTFVVLGNPTHSGELHALVSISSFGAETIPTGRELPAEAKLYDDFQEAARDWDLCRRLDEGYFPWVSPFIGAVEDRRIKAAIFNSSVLDRVRSEDTWLADVLEPLGIPIEAVGDHGGDE